MLLCCVNSLKAILQVSKTGMLDILERLGSFPKNLILFMVVVVILHPYILKLNTTYYK